tara:strand:+ start:446 stop:1000 length:555 start_codon:yes stop_codon:yes gene_type:complete
MDGFVTATLKQINVSYSLLEDRIAVKFLDSNMLEVCAWLTYSVTAAFLPHMSKVLGVEYGIPGPAAVDTQTVSHPEQSTEKGHARLQFEKEAAAVASKSQTYLGDHHKSEEGEELLIKEGRLAEKDQGFQLILWAFNGRQATINMNRKTALAMLNNLENIVGKTVWVIPNIPNISNAQSTEVRH